MINNLGSYHLPNEENIYSQYLTKKKVDKEQFDNIVKNIERNEDYLARKKLIKDFDVSFVDNPNSKKLLIVYLNMLKIKNIILVD